MSNKYKIDEEKFLPALPINMNTVNNSNSEMIDEVKAALSAIHAIAETIRKFGEISSGELYARLMGKIELRDYEQIIATLKKAGLVTETSSHVLRWNEPEPNI